MDLRCLVFSSDNAAAKPICQVLAEMGAEAEHCPEAVAAVERVASEPFQIVIVDWDQQPEAEFFLKAARGRKASERPLTLAVVSDDASVPKALQAGANSILRKPIIVGHVKDTLQTARSLLKARQESVTAMAAVAAAGPSPAATFLEAGNDAHLHAGEFLQSTGPSPSTQIDTESEMLKSIDRSAAAEIDPLKDLEPMAAAVTQEPPPPPSLPPPAPPSDEPRGLQWYLNQRTASAAPSPQQTVAPQAPSRPELLGFDQIPSYPDKSHLGKKTSLETLEEPPAAATDERGPREQVSEANGFAFVGGENSESHDTEEPRFRLGKGTLSVAVALAVVAIAAAPQAPWHPQARALWGKGRQAVHGWLNPQPVAPPQAPAAHEDFGRAGDEYKLPVAETIPDATTDPSQIRVVPMVDPTKKPVPPDPNLAPIDATPANPGDTPQPQDATSPGAPTQGNQEPGASVPSSQPSQTAPSIPQATTPVATPAHTDPFASAPANSAPVQPAPPRNPAPRPVSTSPGPPIPSSLKSQMASPTPEASGNRAPETAMPSIEPVAVPEVTERGLLTTQPPVPYPANAKGQQGTVVLQVLIGRDGTVQDAKFLQGSLAFARTAIDGVKQWQFKPYIMNGRPVSVQTMLTLSFKPGQ